MFKFIINSIKKRGEIVKKRKAIAIREKMVYAILASPNRNFDSFSFKNSHAVISLAAILLNYIHFAEIECFENEDKSKSD